MTDNTTLGLNNRTWTLIELTSAGLLAAITLRSTVKEANKSALSAVNMINWDNSYYRNDIGWRAIKREENG